jgi:hypothetical protein
MKRQIRDLSSELRCKNPGPSKKQEKPIDPHPDMKNIKPSVPKKTHLTGNGDAT